jgi:ferritin
MDISDTLFNLLNTQVSRELQNSDAYAQLAAVSDSLAWDGFSKWLHHSSEEELTHSRKIFDFLIDRNRIPTLESRPVPQVDTSMVPIAWLNSALVLEKTNTQLINELFWSCWEEKDADAANFLHWFIEEQRRSEREIMDLISQVERAAGNDAALKLVDATLLED